MARSPTRGETLYTHPDTPCLLARGGCRSRRRSRAVDCTPIQALPVLYSQCHTRDQTTLVDAAHTAGFCAMRDAHPAERPAHLRCPPHCRTVSFFVHVGVATYAYLAGIEATAPHHLPHLIARRASLIEEEPAQRDVRGGSNVQSPLSVSLSRSNIVHAHAHRVHHCGCGEASQTSHCGVADSIGGDQVMLRPRLASSRSKQA